MNSPTSATSTKRAAGRLTRKTAGNATTVNRIAAKVSGGTCPMPSSMTTKLMPQMVAVRQASSDGPRGM